MMRVDEGRNSWSLLTIIRKARTVRVVGWGKSLLSCLLLVTPDLGYVYSTPEYVVSKA